MKVKFGMKSPITEKKSYFTQDPLLTELGLRTWEQYAKKENGNLDNEDYWKPTWTNYIAMTLYANLENVNTT